MELQVDKDHSISEVHMELQADKDHSISEVHMELQADKATQSVKSAWNSRLAKPLNQ